jgi:hypothetical protein
VRSPDPAAELVQLSEAEHVGAIDEHGVGVGDVEAGFDDHRRDEHIDVAVDEAAHYLFELALRHLSVADTHARARHHPLDMVRDSFDRLDAIVNEEYLPATIELPGNSLLDEPVIPRFHVGEHG